MGRHMNAMIFASAAMCLFLVPVVANSGSDGSCTGDTCNSMDRTILLQNRMKVEKMADREDQPSSVAAVASKEDEERTDAETNEQSDEDVGAKEKDDGQEGEDTNEGEDEEANESAEASSELEEDEGTNEDDKASEGDDEETKKNGETSSELEEAEEANEDEESNEGDDEETKKNEETSSELEEEEEANEDEEANEGDDEEANEGAETSLELQEEDDKVDEGEKEKEEESATHLATAAPAIPYSRMVASQSSNYRHGLYLAKAALTKHPRPRWPGTCTHTKGHRMGRKQWWKVELRSTYSISAVKITNRADCCGYRLHNIDIYVGRTKCASGVRIGQGKTQTVPCKGFGSDIKIQSTKTDWLTLCGFEAFGVPAPAIPYSRMVASQSSNYRHGLYLAKAALTKHPRPRWPGTCTHTKGHRMGRKQWWKVALKSTYSISAVTITNRADCCGYRLHNIDIYVGRTKCASGVRIGQGKTETVPCEGIGSDIKIQSTKTDWLTLCGFEALGVPAIAPIALEQIAPTPTSRSFSEEALDKAALRM